MITVDSTMNMVEKMIREPETPQDELLEVAQSDANAFAAQDSIDYTLWCDFAGDLAEISTPVLRQMLADLSNELDVRRKPVRTMEDSFMDRLNKMKPDFDYLAESVKREK